MVILVGIFIYNAHLEIILTQYVTNLGNAKLIPCLTEHQGNEVGLVGRRENK